jgi:hypothetical protein
VSSLYLWSFSNNYRRGKYVADGIWSARAEDRRCGCMPMLKGMMALDPTIAAALQPPAAAPPTSVPSIRQTTPAVRPAPAPAPAAPRLSWLARLAASLATLPFKRKA